MKKTFNFSLSLIALYLSVIGINANDVTEWTFNTGNRVIASPLIHNDTLFAGSLDGNFYAINLANGAELWRYTTNNEIRTTAALYENTKIQRQ